MSKKHRIEAAGIILAAHLNQIRTVADWAIFMGWDRTEFSRQYRRKNGVSAKDKLRDARFGVINDYLSQQPDARYYEVAYDLGFRDEKALYDYVRYHYKCSPTVYKNRVLNPKNIDLG